MRKILAFISKFLNTGYCRNCKISWSFIKPHYTPLTPWRGCFILCKHCWSKMTIAERLPFYKDLWFGWDDESISWDIIKDAVLSGR